jgi:1-aminocyclopropane-1-carboxylate deaminase/D-cysteine desulfhydrase-like pyridoxal-dependent ACC family enzyme
MDRATSLAQAKALLAYLEQKQAEFAVVGLDVTDFMAATRERIARLQNDKTMNSRNCERYARK